MGKCPRSMPWEDKMVSFGLFSKLSYSSFKITLHWCSGDHEKFCYFPRKSSLPKRCTWTSPIPIALWLFRKPPCL